MLLCAVNRRGLITNQMDDGPIIHRSWPWGASVSGVIMPGPLARLQAAAEPHGIRVETRRSAHKRRILGDYRGVVQDSAYAELRRAQCVIVADPVRGRAGRESPLWAALHDFARA